MTAALESTGPMRAPTLSFADRQRMHAVPGDNMTTQDVQAASEGVVLDDLNSIEFLGKRFRLAESVGLMPLLKFAFTAKQGVGVDDLEGLAAMYTLIRGCIDRSQVQQTDGEGKAVFDEAGAPVWAGPSQWDLFEQHATDTNASGDDLSDLITRAIQVISARPPKSRGDSSPSSRPTSANTKDSSSLPGTRPAPPGFTGLTPVGDLGQNQAR
jgi:hypothetical protein